MKRWRNGLAVASVIWWHDRPLWAFPRMRSDARGYPWWPGTQTFRSRAGYRSARPITSKSSLSACNARPVHTEVPLAVIAAIRRMVRFLRRRGHGQGKALTLGGVAETFVALNRGPRVQAMEI